MALKRSNAGGSSSASPKKQKSNLEVAKVVQAIEDYASLPTSVKEMLCSAFPFAFSAPDQPHEFKKNIVNMVETTLKTIENELEVAAKKANAFAAESGDKERIEKQYVDAARSVANQKCNVANKEADFTEAQLYQQRMNSAERSIRTKNSAENAEYETLKELKKDLADLDGRVAVVKQQPIEQSMAKKLLRDLKHQGLNASLMNSFSGIVARPLAERTAFDTLTVQNLEDELATLSQNVTKKLEDESGPQESRVLALQKAHHEADEAKSKMCAASTALKDSQHSLRDAETKLAELKDVLDNFAKHLKGAQEQAEAATEEVEDFQASVLSPFREWANATQD